MPNLIPANPFCLTEFLLVAGLFLLFRASKAMDKDTKRRQEQRATKARLDELK